MAKEVQIFLPKMGESVMEATITEWLKKPGERVEKDEPFVTISTDKVESELPSEYEGLLKTILVEKGEEVKVGHPIAVFQIADDTTVHQQYQQNSVTENRVTTEKMELLPDKKLSDKSFLSPVVRKIAAEYGLELDDLNQIQPTGENGRIRKIDIQRFLSKNISTPQQAIAQKLELNIQPEDKVEVLPRIRRTAAELLQTSYQLIPHVTTFLEVNVNELVEYRNRIKDQFQKENGLKITYTHFIMKKVIENLLEFPKFNAWLNADELILKKNINLGFATALPDGNLIVPNLKKANELSLREIVEKVNQIGNNAKAGKLKPDHIRDTTFTVSNTGIFGSMMGTPIISRPQVAVLALGQIRSAAGVVEKFGKEEIAVCKMMMISLSYDHRVIDGALASQFLSALKQKLESIGG